MIKTIFKCHSFHKTESLRLFSVQTNNEIKDRIIKHALDQVKMYGWQNALEQGCEKEGLLSTSVKGLFPDGPIDLINAFLEASRTRIEDATKTSLFEQLSLTKKISLCSWEYLSYKQPFLSSWIEAMGIIMSTKPHLALTWTINTSDHIWSLCGDKSISMDWYTKRFTLSAILKTAELYMLQDKSENFENTLNFMQRQFDSLSKFNYTKSQIMSQVGLFYSILQDYKK